MDNIDTLSKFGTSFQKKIITSLLFRKTFLQSIFDILDPKIFDSEADRWLVDNIKKYFLESKGDDKLLITISNFFLQKGFPLFNWIEECPELIAKEDNLTKVKPSKEAILNCNKGLEVFKIIGNADIGQSMIVQNQLILGLETVEGTDELIKRCSNYLRDGDPGILIKLSKYSQNPYLDVPVIGIQTLINLKEYNYKGVFLEKGKCLILNKEAVLNFCNLNKIFISTIVKS